jgi:hypothetical protein
MCCWPKDRQANDGNGNCATPYDENCVDKDPADNTNLCFADLAKGNLSSGFDSNDGFMAFPGDNNNGEGAIHCHGFAWADDEYDSISRYKANNLFFVSMYDHMHQRGYVKNIPGMPMCGCMEQMPMATRSDCTQVDLTEDWKIEFDGVNSMVGTLTKVEIDFNACRGRNNRNNDLWAYAARLYDEGRMTRHQFGAVGRVLTNDHDCYHGVEMAKSQKGYVTGYNHDETAWTFVAGRDNMNDGGPFGREAFNAAFFEQNLDDVSVMMRICPDCVDTHRRIYYRRKSGKPTNANFDLLHNILYQRNDGNGDNRWDEDFSLHSSYEDAVSGENPWQCPGDSFNYDAPFVGNCSPDGSAKNNQYSIFSWYPGPRPNVAYYVNKPQNTGVQDFIDNASITRSISMTDVDVGDVGIPGNTLENNGVYHITASGQDIWNHADSFHYKSQPYEGDVDVSVNLSSFSNNAGAHWSKAGIMLRSDNSPDATYAFISLSGKEGIIVQGRRSKGNHAFHKEQYKEDPYQTSAMLRIVKTQETVEFYRGDGAGGWILMATDTYFFPNDQYRVGLAVSANSQWTLAEATFEDYNIAQYAFPTSAPTLSSAPTPWQPLVDINAQRAGEYYEEEGTGKFWAKGSGTGIWGTSDSFMYYNTQELDIGELSVEMKIDHFHAGQQHARAGLMIRNSNADTCANAFVGAGGSYGGAVFQSRSSTAAPTEHHKMIWQNWQNAFWVKLHKAANTVEGGKNKSVITAYYKLEEADEWIELGSTQLTLNGATIQVGRAVTAGDDYQWALVEMQGQAYNIA